MHVDQRQLQYFLAVANAGSINRAATSLHIAQPALSRRIQQLEHALGVELFVRTKGGVNLTLAGQRLYRRAAAWLQEFERLQGAMRDEVEAEGSVLRLGMAAGPTVLLLPRVMTAVAEALPDVPLRVIEGDRPSLHEQILARQLDFAISTEVSAEPRIAREPLWIEDLFLVTPAHTLHTTAQRPPFVVPTSDTDIERAVLEAAGAVGMLPDTGIAVTPTASVKRLILAGAACSILPFSAIHEEAQAGKLDVQAIPGACIERHLIWLDDRPQSQAATALHGVIRRCVGEMLAALGGENLRGSVPAAAGT